MVVTYVDPMVVSQALRVARDLLSIAEIAMPDTYFETDSRCKRARAFIKKWERVGKENTETAKRRRAKKKVTKK